MTLFYLIRHAEIKRGAGDPGITKAGQAQAAAVGIYLKDKGITRIYTSPLNRARETAQIISAELGAPQTVDARLRERVNWGDVAGQSWAEFQKEWTRSSRDPDYIPPGGRSARQAAVDLASFISDTARQHPHDSLAAVTHEGILDDFLDENFPPSLLDRLNPEWEIRHDDVIAHCSITTLRWETTGMRLEDLAVVLKP